MTLLGTIQAALKERRGPEVRRTKARSFAKHGFSLLEVIIAGTLFIISITATVSSWKSVTGMIDTQTRRGEAITLAEDVMDDLRLCFRGADDLTVGTHRRFFNRARDRVNAEDTRGYTVEWVVVPINQQTFKRVDLVVRWIGADGRPHSFPFVTYRSS